MKITNTMDMPTVASFNAIIYGPGGVGKTTMASTFPKPLLLDFENGAKFFKSRDISLDTIQFSKWPTKQEKIALMDAIDPYQTIIIDPIGTAMNMLIEDDKAIGGRQFRNGNGGLTIPGWGEAKKQTFAFVKWLISTRKNVILIAHLDEKEVDGVLEREPLIPTKLKWDLINIVDVVAFFDTREVKDEKTGKKTLKRFLNTIPGMGHVAKDRTGKLQGIIKPEWDYIKNLLEDAVDPKAKQPEPEQPAEPVAPQVEAPVAPVQPAVQPTPAPVAQAQPVQPVAPAVAPEEVATITPEPKNIGQALTNLDEVIANKKDAIINETNQANIAILKNDLKGLLEEKAKRDAEVPVAEAPAEKVEAVEPTVEVDPLESKTIKDLMDLATTLGKEVPAGTKKADIIKILKG